MVCFRIIFLENGNYIELISLKTVSLDQGKVNSHKIYVFKSEEKVLAMIIM